jgi:hypothetical protein
LQTTLELRGTDARVIGPDDAECDAARAVWSATRARCRPSRRSSGSAGSGTRCSRGRRACPSSTSSAIGQRPCPRRIRARQVRAARGPRAALRPGQPVPPQPEHRAGRLGVGAIGARTPAALRGEAKTLSTLAILCLWTVRPIRSVRPFRLSRTERHAYWPRRRRQDSAPQSVHRDRRGRGPTHRIRRSSRDRRSTQASRCATTDHSSRG